MNFEFQPLGYFDEYFPGMDYFGCCFCHHAYIIYKPRVFHSGFYHFRVGFGHDEVCEELGIEVSYRESFVGWKSEKAFVGRYFIPHFYIGTSLAVCGRIVLYQGVKQREFFFFIGFVVVHIGVFPQDAVCGFLVYRHEEA